MHPLSEYCAKSPIKPFRALQKQRTQQESSEFNFVHTDDKERSLQSSAHPFSS